MKRSHAVQLSPPYPPAQGMEQLTAPPREPHGDVEATGQGRHVAPVGLRYRPASQGLHVAVSGSNTRPAFKQKEQKDASVAPMTVVQVPVGHVAATAEPPLQKLYASQREHLPDVTFKFHPAGMLPAVHTVKLAMPPRQKALEGQSRQKP